MMDCTLRKRATGLWVRLLRRDWLRFYPHRLLRAVKVLGQEKLKKVAGRDKEKRKPQSREKTHDFTSGPVIC